MDEVVGVAPSGSLGSGFDIGAFEAALEENPDFIGQDAGSSDMGPFYHGTSNTFLPRATYKYDLSIMLEAARSRGIPLIVGSVFTSGSRQTLASGAEIMREIAHEKGLSFCMAVIDAEIAKDDLKARIREHGDLTSLGPTDPLTDAVIDRCGPICAQMGPEPIIEALENGAEVILCGRACDDAIFAALPIMRGYDRGLSLHMGKILECAGISAVPCDLAEPLVGRIRDDHFIVRPGNSAHRCTTVSVAAHSLYERSDPCLQPGPGGINDLTNSRFHQEDERTVLVSGSSFVPDSRYMVKIEGAEHIGYRSIVIVGIRDAVMIREIDVVLEAVRDKTEKRFTGLGNYRLDFKIYGKNGVMGPLEYETEIHGHEIGILIEVIADDQDFANGVVMFTRGTLQHIAYKDIITTAGNLAYPFSPFSVPVGPAFRFAAYHLLELASPTEIFPIHYEQVTN